MTQIFKSFETNFFKDEYNGHKIVIHKVDNKQNINYTKLVNSILGPCSFKELVRTKRFIKCINTGLKLNIIKVFSLSHLTNLTNGLIYQVKGNAKINGTYGPFELIEYILNLCDITNHDKLKNIYQSKINDILKKYNINNPELIKEINDVLG